MVSGIVASLTSTVNMMIVRPKLLPSRPYSDISPFSIGLRIRPFHMDVIIAISVRSNGYIHLSLCRTPRACPVSFYPPSAPSTCGPGRGCIQSRPLSQEALGLSP
jgi:hypothetical protein